MDSAKEIIKAATNGQVNRLKKLLTGDPQLINDRDIDGSTPLQQGRGDVAFDLVGQPGDHSSR